jgi:hypothetical protein
LVLFEHGAMFAAPPRRVLQVICPTGTVRDILSSPSCKNILIFRNSKSVYLFAIPFRQEGRCANVINAGRAAVDADGAF